ncbi:hypothetical protein [Thalassospira australica]|uniref:hypothetical protein n=1 Tax=Thalassospira australica TaxID=1528106 RepID=UPI00384B6282
MHRLYSHLYPLWLVIANLVARLGGMITLLLVGHHFAPDQLAGYFTALATIGLAVTIAQAGCGPLLIRLYQTSQIKVIVTICALRVTLALAATAFVITTTDIPLSPILLMPLAAALAPDWIITGRGQLSQIALIAVFGQIAGIITAVIAIATNSNLTLFAIAPAISLASLIAGFLLALREQATQQAVARKLTGNHAINLIGFILLAGALPNLDFVLLGQNLPDAAHDNLMLGQRIFLITSAIIASISTALFAKRQSGLLRDIWLITPPLATTAILLFIPETLALLFYGTTNADLVTLLRTGAFWPALLAMISRQILISQETENRLFPGWLCLALLVVSGLLLPAFPHETDALIVMQLRLTICLFLMLICHRSPILRNKPA